MSYKSYSHALEDHFDRLAKLEEYLDLKQETGPDLDPDLDVEDSMWKDAVDRVADFEVDRSDLLQARVDYDYLAHMEDILFDACREQGISLDRSELTAPEKNPLTEWYRSWKNLMNEGRRYLAPPAMMKAMVDVYGHLKSPTRMDQVNRAMLAYARGDTGRDEKSLALEAVIMARDNGSMGQIDYLLEKAGAPERINTSEIILEQASKSWKERSYPARQDGNPPMGKEGRKVMDQLGQMKGMDRKIRDMLVLKGVVPTVNVIRDETSRKAHEMTYRMEGDITGAARNGADHLHRMELAYADNCRMMDEPCLDALERSQIASMCQVLKEQMKQEVTAIDRAFDQALENAKGLPSEFSRDVINGLQDRQKDFRNAILNACQAGSGSGISHDMEVDITE